MKIIKLNLSDQYRIQHFIDLPFRIYRDNQQWVPPLATDAKNVLDPQKNAFFKHSTAAFFLAVTDDGSPVGRLVILNNRNFNSYNHTQMAYFCLFESFNDRQIAKDLFEEGFEWARKQKLTTISGPKGFSALDGMGMLIKGFDHRPAFGVSFNPDYYPNLIESVGFEKESDIVSGYLSTEFSFPEKIHKISELVQQRRGLKIVTFRNKRDLRRMVPTITAMYNEILESTPGSVPLTEEEAEGIANMIIWVANPRLIKIIEKDNKPVGFLFAYPDISAALQRTKGRIFPFGWLQLILEMRRTKWVNINGAGIIEQYQGMGGTAILFSEMYKSVLEGGFKHADIVQIGVENDKMQRELRELGIDFYKIHRVYKRAL
jgi:hypothetical protein